MEVGCGYIRMRLNEECYKVAGILRDVGQALENRGLNVTATGCFDDRRQRTELRLLAALIQYDG